jgi:hypothetical protein
MRIVLHLAALAAGAAIVYFGSSRPTTSTPSANAAVAVPVRADDSLQLSKQVAALQREVAALKSQAARQQTEPSAQPAESDASTATEAERTAEAEQHRVYMAEVAQAFAAEKVDFKWAGYASSRLAATLQDDAVLGAAAHEFECRQQTCRLQIDDDGSGKVSQRLTMMSLHLMDIFPTAAAELVDQGNGRNALVLYMSSQPGALPAGTAK